MKRKGITSKIIISVISFFIAISCLIIAFTSTSNNISELYDISNTKEYVGTLSGLKCKNGNYYFTVIEYSCGFCAYKDTLVNDTLMSELKDGETITFTISKYVTDEQLNDPDFTGLVVFALKSDTVEFVTLESYSKSSQTQFGTIRNGAYTFSAIFFSVGVLFIILLIRRVKRNKQNQIDC